MLSKLRGLSLLVLALAIGALAVGCGSSSSSSSSSDQQPHRRRSAEHRPGGNREAKGEINSGNVNQLKEAWSIPVEGQGIYGSYASTPLIINGVVYSQDLESNVSAIDLESGDVLWETKLESPSHGPNGLAVAEGRVYGATNGRRLRARPEDRQGTVDGAAGRSRGRHGAGGTRRQGLRLHGPGEHQTPNTKRARSARSGRWTRKPGRNCGTSTPSPKTSGANRTSTPAAASGTRPPSTAKGNDLRRHRQPGAADRERRTTPGARAAPATTATPTRW